ncbi:NAD kinase [Cardinium endosymbiont of Culicoides punctatus]|uniref:NAD kinase n=1 Tax=Cardinium endosymbiont of Culicoides punctatus TaxID=2304601 RepID=UPI001058FB44|nr:NAD kinase [Cardinium endosymbiont of Culicoides punctatus]TDG95551.1 NAD kinase [Cardinium endosymbiont of Culicoides punctatus]
MSIAIHSRQVCSASIEFLEKITLLAKDYNKKVIISTTFAQLLNLNELNCLKYLSIFDIEALNALHVELMISLGGDGTLLETTHYINDKAIPLLGVNTGTLGFLTMLSCSEAVTELIHFFEGDYAIEQRTILSLCGEHISDAFALNEVALLKRDTASLLTIDAYIDEKFITTYWADGLIIATPTGSTAYSLSCLGPIMLPSANNFVITPLSPHNLAVRPLVVPETAKLSFIVKGRDKDMLIAVDGRSIPAATQQRLVIEKAPFILKLVQLGHTSLFDVLREKLYWGMDCRKT